MDKIQSKWQKILKILCLVSFNQHIIAKHVVSNSFEKIMTSAKGEDDSRYELNQFNYKDEYDAEFTKKHDF